MKRREKSRKTLWCQRRSVGVIAVPRRFMQKLVRANTAEAWFDIYIVPLTLQGHPQLAGGTRVMPSNHT